uniref:serine/threonine-protein kinase Nek2 isoform X1 n=1 Tax=Ciona intestinalis TaxID=7719 RepID=UPI00089DC643|nr:serine/threonine-protein kinase Nek2 isoform X1 [Ciona intestinalis]|eukprot:XP_018669499.1 serine/threonine-protein kinase Nek2 isoform X1 [Ciona intestinalis]
MPSKLSDYDILHLIGSGSYGKCLKVRRRSDSKILVWKDMDYGSMTEPEKQQLVSEVNLLRELKHRFIVRYHDRIIDRSKSRLYLIMEYCAGGDLASLITKCRRERNFLEEDFILKIFCQLLLALQACHGQRRRNGNQGKVLHRDLKPANVFLDENKDVKLGDFGLARVLNHDTSFAKTFVGTPYYMSPEQMNKMQYNDKSDIWSLGCLIYELCALVPPFTAPNQKMLAVKIKEGQFRRIPSKYSNELQDCVASMLNLTSTSRPSLEHILSLNILKKHAKEHDELNSSVNSQSPVVSTEEKHAGVGKAIVNHRRLSPVSDIPDDRSSPSAILKAREASLDERTREVERSERDLQRRERLLEDREKAAEEKMRTAESLIRQYRELCDDRKIIQDSSNINQYRLDLISNKKQVHFAGDSKFKENRDVLGGLGNMRYNGGKAGLDYGKLHNARMDDIHRKYREVQKPSYYKKRPVLGIR